MSSTSPTPDWRPLVTKSCSALQIGGFRPTQKLTASCFGEIRAAKAGQDWPDFNRRPLWPVCQLNLLDAPFVPPILADIALIQVFVSDEYWASDVLLFNTDASKPNSPFVIRTYETLDALQALAPPDHASPYKPFESAWAQETQTDYPTHDTMPIDFDALGVGDFYDQDDIDQVQATKIGGWPSCIQSEPWWDYNSDGHEFEYAFQIDSEEKANCFWGDGGVVYIARHASKPNLWAIDSQCF